MLKIPQNFTISLTDMSLITKKKKEKKKVIQTQIN